MVHLSAVCNQLMVGQLLVRMVMLMLVVSLHTVQTKMFGSVARVTWLQLQVQKVLKASRLSAL